jgi:hypothetical protein
MAGSAPPPTYFGPSGMEDVSGSSGSSGGGDSILNATIRFDTIDAITTLYASKLMEGYTLAENGEVCFRCHMPLMQRGEQEEEDKYAYRGLASTLLDLDESTSIVSGPKRICVVCHEEWESADSFEQKLVVFSAMQAAQTQLEGEDDDENEDSSREDVSSRCGDKYSHGVSVPRQSTTLNDDGETNNVGDDYYTDISNRMDRVKFNIPALSEIVVGDDDSPLETEDLIIASSQEKNEDDDDEGDDDDDDDGDAMMNIEVTLRTRCKCCALDLPISESLQYYPHGAAECSFCSAADGDSFDLSVIQANLDMLDVKEELLMGADDRSAERETKEDESSIIIAAGEEDDDDSRIMSPIMETDGAEVKLMTDWNDGDQVVPSAGYDDCSQTKDATHRIAQEEREDIETNGVTVQSDESNNSSMSADESIVDMQPQQHVNDSIPAVSYMANPPRDKEHFVKGLIATFLQQNLFGQSGPSLNGDNGGKANTMCSDYEKDQNVLKTDPSMPDDVGSKRNRNSHSKRWMKTATFTRDPPTNGELDPPTTDAISSGEDMRQVSSSSRGMDPPESAEDMLDSRDTSSSPANSTSIDTRDSFMKRWFPGKSSLTKLKNDTLPETKVPLRHESTIHSDATKRVDRSYSSNDTVNDAHPPTFKFHAKKQYDKPIQGDGEPILSEDDVRGQLALLKFQFSRKATMGKEMIKSSILPTTTKSLHLQTDNNEHRTMSSNGTTAPCSKQQLLPLSPTAAARHQRIKAENNEHRTTNSSSTTAPCSKQQLLPLSPTAAARHKRIKEDLIASRKAMSLNPPSSLVSIE